MFIFKSFSLVFAYFIVVKIHSIRIDELEEITAKIGITSACVGNNVSYVYINNSYYEIYTYDEECDINVIPKFYSNTLAKLYTCISCKFAEWTQNELFKTIETLPIVYQLSFLSLHDDIFMTYIKGSDQFLRHITVQTEKFIKILLNFQNIYWNENDTSADMHISTTLLRLNFAVSVLNIKNNNGHFLNNQRIDFDVARIILEAINSIQNFTYLNCKLNIHYDNKQFYGFSMKKEDETNRDIDEFLNEIKPLHLDEHENCTVNQILFKGKIIENLYGVKWKTDNGIALVENVLENIKVTDDLSIIFWYQRYMFTTITYLLFKTLKTYYERYTLLSKEILSYFNDWINSMALTKIPNLSPELRECIHCLASHNHQTKYSERNGLVIAIKNYEDSIPVIFVKDPFKITSSDDFITILNTFTKESNCFIRLFKYFSFTYSDITYHRAIFTYSTKIAQFERDVATENKTKELFSHLKFFVKDSKSFSANNTYHTLDDLYKDRGCKLFIGLYHYCVKIVIDLNRIRYESKKSNETQVKSKYYQRIESYLDKILEHFKELLPGYHHLSHLKVVLNIIPQIILGKQFLYSKKKFDELKRTVYVVMTELNMYGIHYCNPPEYNFLLFNNLNFDKITQLSFVEDFIKDQIKSLKVEKSKLISINNWYITIMEPFTQIMNRIDDFDVYERFIKQNWKGKKRTMGYMYNCLTSTTLSASTSFAALEFFLKFALAVFFYESDKNIRDIFKSDHNLTEKMYVVYGLDPQKFPNKFTNVITIMNMYNYWFSETKMYLDDKRNKVLKEFEKIGVFIKFDHSLSSFFEVPYYYTTSKPKKNNKRNQKIEDIITVAKTLNEAIFNLEFFEDM